MNRKLGIAITISFVVLIMVLIMTYIFLGDHKDEVSEYRYEEISVEYSYDGFNIKARDLLSSMNSSSLLKVKEINQSIIALKIDERIKTENGSIPVRSDLHIGTTEDGHVTSFKIVFAYSLEEPMIFTCSSSKDKDRAYAAIRSRYEKDIDELENITEPVVDYLDSLLDTRGKRSEPRYLEICEKNERSHQNRAKGRNP